MTITKERSVFTYKRLLTIKCETLRFTLHCIYLF